MRAVTVCNAAAVCTAHSMRRGLPSALAPFAGDGMLSEGRANDVLTIGMAGTMATDGMGMAETGMAETMLLVGMALAA